MAPLGRSVIVASLFVGLAGTLGVFGGTSSVPTARGAAAPAAGSPSAGRAVFLQLGCGGCHALAADATFPTTGPPLTPEGLAERARSVGKPLGAFVAEAIVSPDADIAPGYVSGVMRPFKGLTRTQLDDLVSFLIGAPYTSPPPKLPANPVAACTARPSCRATVARWVKVAHLPATAVPGAKIVASVGCLSCHRYLGTGVRGPGPDLTREGLRGRSAAELLRRLRCPACVRKGSVMPSFAALGDANLRSVVTFLRASRGAKS